MSDDSDAVARVDAYLAALPDDQRAALERLRANIKAAAPDAVEAISYSMPAFRLGRRVLVYYAAFSDHLSLFPASGSVRDKLGEELRGYFSGKGTIRFTPQQPLPDDLLREILASSARRAERLGGRFLGAAADEVDQPASTRSPSARSPLCSYSSVIHGRRLPIASAVCWAKSRSTYRSLT